MLSLFQNTATGLATFAEAITRKPKRKVFLSSRQQHRLGHLSQKLTLENLARYELQFEAHRSPFMTCANRTTSTFFGFCEVCAIDDINCYLLAQKLGPTGPWWVLAATALVVTSDRDRF